ncbi:hypothetical protein LCGC14_0595850 [marine sediment metagenome]|uniref:Uncharacterized protein n=1 Tax=marine sediment metagenome TaxID=412755 RepID=A0A0F9TY74_9ZZZZ
MDEDDYYDSLNRSIKFTTGDVLIKWMKLKDKKLRKYAFKWFRKNLSGSYINVTESFLVKLSKKYKLNEDELDGLRYVLKLRFGCIIVEFGNDGILEKQG